MILSPRLMTLKLTFKILIYKTYKAILRHLETKLLKKKGVLFQIKRFKKVK